MRACRSGGSGSQLEPPAALGRARTRRDPRGRRIMVASGPTRFWRSLPRASPRLAFRMSVKRMEYLGCLRVVEHGVDPDAPKNVSKSITVD